MSENLKNLLEGLDSLNPDQINIADPKIKQVLLTAREEAISYTKEMENSLANMYSGIAIMYSIEKDLLQAIKYFNKCIAIGHGTENYEQAKILMEYFMKELENGV